MEPYDLMKVALIVQQMRRNSVAWHGADETKRQELQTENRSLANRLNGVYGVPVVYNPDGGTWRVGTIEGPMLYDLY